MVWETKAKEAGKKPVKIKKAKEAPKEETPKKVKKGEKQPIDARVISVTDKKVEK